MAIVDTQRTAVEQLIESRAGSALPNFDINATTFKLEDGTPLNFVCFSTGHGVYSRHPNTPVLVLTALETRQQSYSGEIRTGNCEWVVLYREATPEEIAAGPNQTSALGCFELLEVANTNDGEVLFRKTGDAQTFVRLV